MGWLCDKSLASSPALPPGRVPHVRGLSRTWVEQDGRPGFPATRHWPTATCAAFSKESRMRLANATKLHRKSGTSPSFFFSCK
jgi:hypothetical protein